MAWLRKNKRGQAEAQFNWIFVLVVGGIILLFFTVIVLRQKSFSEQKLSANLATDLDTIFAGASVSKGTVHSFNIPNLDMNFDCSRFYMGPASKDLGKQVVFAPSRVKGDQLLTWTLEWNFPFKVTNFLYVSSPEVRYVFVYDSSGEDLVALINESLPDGLNVEFDEVASVSAARSFMGSISNKNNYAVRFVFIGSFGKLNIPSFVPSSLSKMSGDSLTAVLVEHSDLGVRTIHFYGSKNGSFVLNNPGDSVSFDFISSRDELEGLPSLFGAIFSDNLESYDCVMKKAFERLELVSSVYLDKVDNLKNFYDASPGKSLCASSVSSARSFIEDINSKASVCKTLFYSISCPTSARCCSDIELVSGAGNMNDAAVSLEEKNRKLLFYSCALVY
jgi:hypothetical protein